MINQNPKRSDEPVWWGLFGAGVHGLHDHPCDGTCAGHPSANGHYQPEAMSYERVADFATSIIGALFIIATLALPMWHAMHRLHHGMHDLKIHAGVVGKIACYFFAALISALSVIFIFMI